MNQQAVPRNWRMVLTVFSTCMCVTASVLSRSVPYHRWQYREWGYITSDIRDFFGETPTTYSDMRQLKLAFENLNIFLLVPGQNRKSKNRFGGKDRHVLAGKRKYDLDREILSTASLDFRLFLSNEKFLNNM